MEAGSDRRVDADRDDDGAAPGDSDQRLTRLSPVAGSYGNRVDETREGRAQCRRPRTRAFGLERGKSGAGVGHGLLGLDELVPRRELLREQLRGRPALCVRGANRIGGLEVAAAGARRDGKCCDGLACPDGGALRHEHRRHLPRLGNADRHHAVLRGRGCPVGVDERGKASLLRFGERDQGASGSIGGGRARRPAAGQREGAQGRQKESPHPHCAAPLVPGSATPSVSTVGRLAPTRVSIAT